MPRLAALTIVLLALLAGCGGDDVAYEEVTGAPPEITIPPDSGLTAAAPAEEGTDEGVSTSETDPEADPATDAGTTAGGTEAPATPVTPDESATGGTTTDGTLDSGGSTAVPEDGPENDTPPEPGSEAEEFEEFCEQNAGAC